VKLFCVIAFHYEEKRLENFYNTYKNLSSIPDIHIVVDSNVRFDNDIQINCYDLSDPYYLTWQHKNYMPTFSKTNFTHFAYLEGNLNVLETTFKYWTTTRELFKRNNLNFIPAVHRVQIGKDGELYSLDCTKKPINRPIVTVENQKFISLFEPYQGMFIMDQEMVEEHITSNYFKIGQKGWYGIRESANLGNMYINVPGGYEHRALLPINNLSDCCVVHYGTEYHSDPLSPHGKIKLNELLDASKN
jgi:hypothetical protein